ncbi:MAG: ABC transporter permease [Sphingomonadaceae bacterium]|nr:ABC transporter permease [Sphingomonadaceae bacterium]
MSETGVLGPIVPAFAAIGRPAIAAFAIVGRVAMFAGRAIARGATPPWYPLRLAEQLLLMGWFALPVAAITALFTGAVLAQQIYIGGSRFNAESSVPTVVVIAMIRELGPLLTGLMIAGRASSAMAAEIGTMRVTEQLDAMETLRTDPYRYLIAPRLLACVIALPALVMVANVIGIFGGYLLSIYKFGFNPSSYLETTARVIVSDDIVISLVKAAVFGFIIALMGCYHGMNAGGGAAGVGRATTNGVVSAFVLILLANLLLTVAAFG